MEAAKADEANYSQMLANSTDKASGVRLTTCIQNYNYCVASPMLFRAKSEILSDELMITTNR